jgi:Zn finger protein HypA/HybF involved in hydrogenase expression
MENFVCLNCKYRFKAKAMPKTCPYCNKNSIDIEKSAEDIVSEIESLIE